MEEIRKVVDVKILWKYNKNKSLHKLVHVLLYKTLVLRKLVDFLTSFLNEPVNQ